MKVPRHIVESRRARLENLLASHRYLPIQEVCQRLQISEATARRDLAALEHAGRLTRTHGGALLEFNDRFPSYTERRKHHSRSKGRMARAALGLIEAGRTYFFDSGTTVAALAEALAEAPRGPLRILTVNLPAAEILVGHSEIEVHLTGGRMLGRQSVLLGEAVSRAVEQWTFDAAFLSAEGMDEEGLWNSQLAIVTHQHAVVRRARHHVFMLDQGKLGRRAAHFLLPWGAVDHLLTDAPRSRVAALSEAAARSYWGVSEPPGVRFENAGASGEIPVHFL